MKSKSLEFKEASTILKSKLQKGRVFQDKKGRQIKVLNDLGNGELEVEVQTLSKKQNEKRGQAKLHMYRLSESRKKICSILITKSKGFDIVFVKVLMEMFLKLMMDYIIQKPGKDPMIQYTQNPQEKTMGRNNVTIKDEVEDGKVQCTECGKLCINVKGLIIHKGKVHATEIKAPNKRKRSESEDCDGNENMCVTCEFKAKTISDPGWHEVRCHRIVTNANKITMKNVNPTVNIKSPQLAANTVDSPQRSSNNEVFASKINKKK